jgi:hypothetical protein
VKAHQVDLPAEIWTHSDLPDADDAYACERVPWPDDRRSSEQWARAVFEGAPQPLRWFILTGWILGLGLRLGPRRSTSHVLGWRILSTTAGTTVLGVESFLLQARLVVQVDEARVLHATFVRYNRRPARLIWPVAAQIHRRLIPYLLDHAAAS